MCKNQGEEMLSEELQKAPEPQVKKEWCISKNWMALVALFVSLTTAYFNLPLQEDDIHTILNPAPYVYLDPERNTMVWGPQGITLINSGNRSAAITEVAFLMVNANAKGETTRDCNAGPTLYLNYEFQPLVLKAGEIVVKTLEEAVPPQPWESIEGHRKRGPQFFMNGDLVLTCLRFTVTTPGSEITEVKVPKNKFRIGEGPSLNPSSVRALSANQPQPLVQRTAIRFLRWKHTLVD
jgi:hypothetical protein